MASGSTFSVFGTDVVVRGDVAASADLHVDGTVVGDITCASLVQGEKSVVEGSITAETARLAGTVKGTITARELVILKSAKIEGDVHYDALTIEHGATVDGRFAHDAGRPAAPAASPPRGEKTDDGEPRLTLAG
ncbi:bactofilin family protein [Tsuneonella sp. HG222]